MNINSTSYLKNKIQFIMLFSMIVMFVLCFLRSYTLGLDKNPGTWATYAVPHSLTDLLLKGSKKYTENKSVRDTYVSSINSESNKDNINVAIQKVRLLNKNTIDKEIYLWENEDKGMLDYITLSFKIFGIKVESINYLYFFIILIASTFFILAYSNIQSKLIFPVLFLTMLYLTMPAAVFNGQLTTLFAPRAFPVLSIISCLHCLLFAINPSTKKRKIYYLLPQVCILVFTTHIRVVTYWQILAVFFASLVGFIIYFKKSNDLRKQLGYFIPSFMIVLLLSLLTCYKFVVIPNAYKQNGQLASRVVWHNIFSGLAYEPKLANKYNLKIDDRSIIGALGDYLIENGRDKEWYELGVLEGGGWEYGYPSIKWRKYDPLVREMFISRCVKHPKECIYNSFIRKPVLHINILSWYYGLGNDLSYLDVFTSDSPLVKDAVKQQIKEATRKLDDTNMRGSLLNPVVLIILFLVFISMIINNKSIEFKTFAAISICAVFSFIPSIIGYPAPHANFDSSIVCGMLIYYVFLCSLFKIYMIMSDYVNNFSAKNIVLSKLSKIYK